MEGQEPPPPAGLPIANCLLQPLFVGSTLPLTASLHHPPPPLLPQEMQNPQMASDNIDWVSLLSGSINNDGQMLPITPTSAYSLRTMNLNEAENANKSKGKSGKTRKYVPPRIAFHTRSAEDILDDGYKWRKYGQKAVKNSNHPRSYYRCTHHTCTVKKQIQRHSKDTSIVVTTYEGMHNHPCEKLMETLTPLLRQLQFLSRF